MFYSLYCSFVKLFVEVFLSLFIAVTMAGKGFRQLTKLSTLDKAAGKQPATRTSGGKSGGSSKAFVETSAPGGIETHLEEPSRKRGHENSNEIVEDVRVNDVSEGQDQFVKKHKDKHHNKSSKLDLENLSLVDNEKYAQNPLATAAETCQAAADFFVC